MAKIASMVIIATMVAFAIAGWISLLFPDTRWTIIESPTTGHCYEQRTSFHLMGYTRSMAPIDDTFCDEKEGIE